MSGRRRRQYREAQVWLAAIPACSCGQWPHDFWNGCDFLRYIAQRQRCSQCGYRYQQRGRRYGWRRWWCERGHAHGAELCLPPGASTN